MIKKSRPQGIKFKNLKNIQLQGICLVVGLVRLLLSLKLLVVLSASMGSALPVGSLAFVLPQTEYFVGDVVTFKIPGSDELLTHRVVGVNSVNGISGVSGAGTYRTQGDTNNVVDDWELTDADILGKVIFHIPFLGYLFYLPRIVLAVAFRR